MRNPIIPLLCCLLVPPTATAQMYRYVDDNGVTVYSQQPPPDRDAQQLAPQSGPSDTTRSEARAALQGRLEAVQDASDDAAAAAEEEAQTSAEAAERRAGCDAARSNLRVLQRAGQQLVRDEEGNLRYAGQEERERRLKEAREQIDELCD